MPPLDAEALAELARLCNEARGRLPEADFYRLRVLLDMVLVELGRQEPPTRERTVPAYEPKPALRQKRP